MVSPDTHLSAVLKLLADPTRLRMLGLLEREELSVGELGRAMDMAQSRVSNHLRLLREGDLLSERHAGTSVYVRFAPEHGDTGLADRLWTTLRHELPDLPEHAADLVRMDTVLEGRGSGGDEFFDRLSGQWDKLAARFESGQARERAAGNLLPRDTVIADLGCGTGYMADALLGRCARLICVDLSQGMLDKAQQQLGRAPRGTQLEYRQGALDDLPLATAEVDGALAGMVLHHLPELDGPLKEMRRILRPGGTLAVLELAPHREEWMRAALGDRHLGLEAADVMASFKRVGFTDVLLDSVQDRYCPVRPDGEAVSLSLYVVRGRIRS